MPLRLHLLCESNPEKYIRNTKSIQKFPITLIVTTQISIEQSTFYIHQ